MDKFKQPIEGEFVTVFERNLGAKQALLSGISKCAQA